MTILLMPDKFKGSLTADQVIDAIRKGLEVSNPGEKTVCVTASDGGDGFLESIVSSQPSVQKRSCVASDPLGRECRVDYGFDEASSCAYIEMARASGMQLLAAEQRNPLKTSTTGTGQVIAHAAECGAEKIYVGLGGSATNDGAMGIAHAIGYRFLDSRGDELVPSGEALEKVECVRSGGVATWLDHVAVFAINDVQNPLLGSEGAAAVYAPQKGADPSMVRRLEQGMSHFESVVQRDLGVSVADIPGAGAAGGTGYGLKVFLEAEFVSGIEFVVSLTDAETQLRNGDIRCIITGEGKLDDQTAYGKLVRGVASLGEKYRVPVIAVCGLNALREKSPAEIGLEKVIAIHDPKHDVQFTIDHAHRLLVDAVSHLKV